jgi:type IV pilus assembly protein PilY1
MRMPSEKQDPSSTQLGIFESSFQNSYVGSDFVAVDYDFDFFTDIFYYGVVKGDSDDWDGGVDRLKVEAETDPSNWGVHKLVDVGEPVTAAPNIGWTEDQVWVYFGSGRFLTADDSRYDASQYFFGVKEPKDTNKDSYNFNTVNTPGYDNPNLNDWIKSSDIKVALGSGDLNCTDGTQTCLPDGDDGKIDTLSGLEDYLVNEAHNGWFRELNATERVVGQATLLGGLVNYTSYLPSDDPCTGEGQSRLYSVYYLTGTAWKENVFGEQEGALSDESGEEVYVEYSKDLGRGLAITPTMHLGSEEGGKVVVQTSTGAIQEVQQPNMPIKNVHSGPSSWHTHDVDE